MFGNKFDKTPLLTSKYILSCGVQYYYIIVMVLKICVLKLILILLDKHYHKMTGMALNSKDVMMTFKIIRGVEIKEPDAWDM